MSAVLRFLTVVLFGLLLVALVTADEPKKASDEPKKAPPPTKEQIDKWIKQLGHDDFDKREEASNKLEEAGEIAESALAEAAKSKDAEVASRAKLILDKFKYGIYPDTPKKVVDLVNSYRNGDEGTRANIIKELFEAGTPGCRALMKLAVAEETPDARDRVMRVISTEVKRAVPALLMEGNYDTLERFLDLSAVGDARDGPVHFNAYYLLRGKLDAAMERVKTKKEFDDKRKQEILAYLYRANGDLKKAAAAAEQAGQTELAEDLLYEGRDWKELANRYLLSVLVHRLLPNTSVLGPDPRKDIEKLGYGAAYLRLAGDKKNFEETIAAIVRHGADAPENEKASAAFYAAKALFLNDRPEEALKVLKASGRADVAFEILCVQLRFDEAFALLEQVKKTGGETASLVEVLAARTLYQLGEKDKAKPMFAKLADTIKAGGMDQSWYEDLIDAEMRVGLREDAFAHTAQILDVFKDAGWSSRLFPKLFGNQSAAAEVWFTHLRAADAEAKPSEQLKKVRALLEGKAADKDIDKLLTDGEAAARTKMNEELDRWIMAVVDTALLYKKDAAAQAMLEKTQTAAAYQRLGDLFAEKKQWDKAAEQYKNAWEKDKLQPLPMYLCGQALVKSGKAADGKKLMDLSHWISLGEDEDRTNFIKGLAQRGQNEANRHEIDLLMRTSKPGQYYAGEAQRRMALEWLAKKEFQKAADAHELAMLRCLKPSVGFMQKGAYVGVPTHVHRLRARVLLDQGKFDDAQKEIAVAQLLLSGDVDLGILLVPELEKSNHGKEAKELFDKELAVHEKLCKEYPNWASAHNSAAWLSVCCGRNLEAAKEHALKATQMAPSNAGHLDTLAEVYFQLGEKDKAIATQKKAIELEPKRSYFRKQLKRIEAGNPKAERPSELDDEE